MERYMFQENPRTLVVGVCQIMNENPHAVTCG
jgi:hypothetical protein